VRTVYAVQDWGLRCRWELSQICDSERAFKIMINSKLSVGFLPLWSRFWEFWANHLKSRLQLNHVPVHETHSAKVRKIPMTSKTPSLTRIGELPDSSKTVKTVKSVLWFQSFCPIALDALSSTADLEP